MIRYSYLESIQSKISELDNLISEACSLFEGKPNPSVSGFRNVGLMDGFVDVIAYHLVTKTNIESECDNAKVFFNFSEPRFSPIFSILVELHKSEKSPTFENYIQFLNEYLIKRRQDSVHTYSIYVPSLIHISLSKEEFKNLNKSLHKLYRVKFKHPSKSIYRKIKGDNIRYLLSSRMVLHSSIQARDRSYALREFFEYRLPSCLGSIAFATYSSRQRMRYSLSKPDYSYAIEPLDDFILVVKDNDIIEIPDPSRMDVEDHMVKSHGVSTIGLELWTIDNSQKKSNYAILDIQFGLNNRTKNEKLTRLIHNLFRLYYQATIEKNLEISFLKYWIIIEYGLKIGDIKRDDDIKRMLKKILRSSNKKTIIDGLYRRRNELVHELKMNYISQSDRNLVKGLAEYIILIYIDPPIKIESIRDMQIFLDNVFTDKGDLMKRKRIVNKIYSFYE